MKQLDWFYWLLVIVVGIFLARLVVLQVIDGDYYRTLAEENRIQLKKLPAERGQIVDRFGQVLAETKEEARVYPLAEVAGHVVGFAREISERELNSCREEEDCRFGLGDIIGKLGIEKQYDIKLRGLDGVSVLEQNAAGEILRELARREPVKGETVSLTLDAGLQKKASELLEDKPGALVASDPQTGEILALVSSPSFDPENLADYLADPDLPLFNRAISGEYPPGSTFKVITSVAALEEGKIDAAEQIEDTGEIKVGEYRYANWYFTQYGKTEGWLDIVRAIKRSNDIFFYRLGERLGIRHLADWARFFGAGEATEVDLPGEATGLMPDPEWKERFWGEKWFLGDTYITAIGQGNILMTPLQVNQMMSVIAGGGQWCQPHLVKFEKNYCRKLDISEETLTLVTEGLKQVNEPGGTAFPLFDFKVKDKAISVAGKTGTAEYGDPEDRTHAWFTAFAPVDKPQIVVTVLLEAGGEGAYQAAPIAKDLLTYWFTRQ